MEDTKQMCIVIEDYIYKRKNVRVRINPRPMDMYNLVMAYNYAVAWLESEKI
jgi:hypothetical protein